MKYINSMLMVVILSVQLIQLKTMEQMIDIFFVPHTYQEVKHVDHKVYSARKRMDAPSITKTEVREEIRKDEPGTHDNVQTENRPSPARREP